MDITPLLAGISQKKIKTGRLEVAYLETGTGETPIVLVHGNTSSSLFFQDFMLALAATNRYTIYAPDMFGFGDTKGPEGTPIWPDFAGSGGGTANPEFVQRIGRGDRGSEQFSPRIVMNTFYFKPPFRVTPDREEIYVTSLLSCKVTEGIYPGDMNPSNNWPNVAPGNQGT